MRDIDKLLGRGNALQTYKLLANAHKDDFNTLKVDELFALLEDEVEELAEEVHKWRNGECELIDLVLEAADVANFAHMIILKAEEEYGD